MSSSLGRIGLDRLGILPPCEGDRKATHGLANVGIFVEIVLMNR